MSTSGPVPVAALPAMSVRRSVTVPDKLCRPPPSAPETLPVTVLWMRVMGLDEFRYRHRPVRIDWKKRRVDERERGFPAVVDSASLAIQRKTAGSDVPGDGRVDERQRALRVIHTSAPAAPSR